LGCALRPASPACGATKASARTHDLLALVYGSFTEGFDTPVLRDAKALLDRLA
jgi:predicted ATPase